MPRTPVVLAILTAMCCLSPPSLRAQDASVKLPAKAAPAPLTVTTLPSGMRLVVLREPDSPVVVTDVFFNVNRLDEGGRAGINALIARMWGVESEWRGADLTRRDLGQVGGAGTNVGDDWVEMWAVSGSEPEQVSLAFRTLLANLVANPRFSPETVEAAKKAQRQAQELEQDNLTLDALQAIRERIFAASPQRLPLLGTETSLRAVKPDDVTGYYQKHFRPERAVICVAGNVDPEQIASKVQSAFGAGDWLTGRKAPPLRRSLPETIPPGLRDRRLDRAAPALTLMAGYIAPGTLPVRVKDGNGSREEGGQTEYATLLLLDAALAGGKSSRLFALRDSPDAEQEPLGYDLRTILQAGQTQSLWAIYVVGASDVAPARARLLSALQAVAEGKPFTDEEVNRARASLKVRHGRERQRPRDRATGAGWAEVMGLGASFDLDFDARLDAVTTADVNRLARRVLSAPCAIVYSSLSTPDAPAMPATSPAPTLSESLEKPTP